MSRQPRWVSAMIFVICLLMVVVAVALLIAVLRLGMPTELLGELTRGSTAAARLPTGA